MELQRNIETVTSEILMIRDNVKRTVYEGVIGIGRRLVEAKDMVPQGQWTSYLEDVLKMKPSSAQNYMRIAREFGNDQVYLDGSSKQELFGDLGYSQLLPLLGVGEEERKEIAEENDLPKMSSREIDQLVKDFKAAQAAQTDAENRAAEAEQKAEKAAKAIEKADKAAQDETNARETAEKKVKDLEGRVQDLLKQISEEKAVLEAKIVPEEEVKAQLEQELRRKLEAETDEKLKAMGEKLKKAKNPAAIQINLLFGQMQQEMKALKTALHNLEDAESQSKMRQAIRSWLEGMKDEI